MEKCQLYEQGKAVERFYLGNRVVFCKIKSESCPYHNAGVLNLEGEEIGIICNSKGLVNKVEEPSTFNIKIPDPPFKFKLKKGARLPVELN